MYLLEYGNADEKDYAAIGTYDTLALAQSAAAEDAVDRDLCEDFPAWRWLDHDAAIGEFSWKRLPDAPPCWTVADEDGGQYYLITEVK